MKCFLLFSSCFLFLVLFLLSGECAAQVNRQSGAYVTKVRVPDCCEAVLLVDTVSGVYDTLCKAAFWINIKDWLIVNDSTVCFILEANPMYMYMKVKRKADGTWESTPSTGVLFGRRLNYVSYVPPGMEDIFFPPRPDNFKIIKEDLVSFTFKEETIIKDCKEFEKSIFRVAEQDENPQNDK